LVYVLDGSGTTADEPGRSRIRPIGTDGALPMRHQKLPAESQRSVASRVLQPEAYRRGEKTIAQKSKTQNKFFQMTSEQIRKAQ